MHAVVNLSGFLMRYFINVESSMDSTLVKSYGGLLNLILATGGSVVIFLICVYYLSKQFIKISIKNNATPALTYD
jgi:hypothetical protein